MTRTAAALTVVLTALVMTADPYACADGCTDGAPLSSSSAASGCVICQRGVAVDTPVSEAPAATPRRRDMPRDPKRVLPTLCRSIDHPPRLA